MGPTGPEMALLGSMMLNFRVCSAAMERRMIWTGAGPVAQVYNAIVDLTLLGESTDLDTVTQHVHPSVGVFLRRCLAIAPLNPDADRFVETVIG